jgi:hypothetical protein
LARAGGGLTLIAMADNIREGDQLFLRDGGDPIGAVRKVHVKERELLVNIENAGDFLVRADAISAVHSRKVILAFDRLDRELKDAVRHAHDAEDR